MINLNKLSLGDKVYVVKEKNNIFSRKKIEMTDENGVRWHRYDKLLWDYEVQEVEYCGKVTYQVEGEISPHYRDYKMRVYSWLMGGKIDYVSENVSNEVSNVIRLVK